MIRLGILGSTRGTLMLALIEAIQERTLNAEIAIVITNKADALIIENASRNQLPALFIDPKNQTREDYDKKLNTILAEYQVDLVVLLGYMRILSKTFVATWADRIINVHPSLLPAFSGLMDLQVHQAVLDAKSHETGCSVHYVTEEVDAGPVIIQKKCPVDANDNAKTLKTRVQALESIALIEAIQHIINKQ